MKAIASIPLRVFNRAVRRLAAFTHRLQHYVDRGLEPKPEWYDHLLDVYWQWPATGSPLFTERGVFSSFAIEQGAVVLDLCSGDGFNARNFYAFRAARVVAVDADPEAIAYARRTHAAPNVQYELHDVRESLPEGPFDNVVWDAAIEHFTEEEIERVLRLAATRLKPGGIVSGHTVIEGLHGKHLREHKREFRDKRDLASFLEPHFAHVTVFETEYPSRTNLYFYASDGPLPLSPGHSRSYVDGAG